MLNLSFHILFVSCRKSS